MIRSYTEMSLLGSFELRYDYLRLNGAVGGDTFGFDRWINQRFYKSREWKQARSYVIARDYGCDLGIRGLEVPSNIHIHHMNPMSVEDIQMGIEEILNPIYLICTSLTTHNAIHYGRDPSFTRVPEPRRPGDTVLW